MIISKVTQKMIDYFNGNLDDINHFLKVWAYAKTIGEAEGLDEETQLTLEITAVVHDISCPLCREKYKSTNGKYQEKESAALLEGFFKDFKLSRKLLDRVTYIVSHHHTYTDVDGPDYQILLEADYLVNADENGLSKENIANSCKSWFKTQTGTALLKNIYKI